MRTDQIPIHGVLSLVLTQGIDKVADFCNVAHNFSYYMAESVFSVRLVNLRSVTNAIRSKISKKMLISEL